MKSTKFSLSILDFLKGLIIAVLTPALLIIQQSLSAGIVVFNWKTIAMASVSGFVGYLIKNFFTDDTKVAENTIIKQGGTIISKDNIIKLPAKGLGAGINLGFALK